MYWNMLKNLDADTKLDLISKLSASLLEREKPDTAHLADKHYVAWATKLAGRWQDDRTAEEIVSDIREARTPNREIEL